MCDVETTNTTDFYSQSIIYYEVILQGLCTQHHKNLALNGAVKKEMCECKQWKNFMSFSVVMCVLVIKTYFQTKCYVTVMAAFTKLWLTLD